VLACSKYRHPFHIIVFARASAAAQHRKQLALSHFYGIQTHGETSGLVFFVRVLSVTRLHNTLA
jgi:hypothetical protein